MWGSLLLDLQLSLEDCSRLRPSVMLVDLIRKQGLFIGDVITSCLNDGAPPSQAELGLCVDVSCESNLMNRDTQD